MKRCAVVAGGMLEDTSWLARRLDEYDMILAADGGLENCRRAGVIPHAVLGDMDSLAGGVPPGCRAITWPAEKDRSDLEIALDHALAEGHERVDVFCALGGRVDHELCNVMVCAALPGRVFMLDRTSLVTALGPGRFFQGDGVPGDTVTLISLEETARCTTRGLRYALDDEELARGSRGLSNVMEGDSFSVSVRSGTVLVIQLLEDKE